MSKTTKIETAKNLSGKDLIKALDWHRINFNPIDNDRCESYDILKDELIKRLDAYDEIIKEEK